MNILQICNKVPFPPNEGGNIAMNIVTQGLLQKGCSVKVLGINTPKHNIDISKLPEEYRNKTNIDAVFINTSIKPLDAFLNLFSTQSYHVKRFISGDFNKKINTILEETTFDIIQFETLYITPYLPLIRKHSTAKVVLRAHNVEHLIWLRMAETTANPIKKKYLQLLASRLKKYELSQINEFDGIAAITDVDKKYFQNNGCTKPIIDIPIACEIPDVSKDISEDFPSLFHIGSMDWMPNQEAIRWFLQKVWPLINIKLPHLKFYIAGRNMPEWLIKYDALNVVVLGEVKSAVNFMLSKSLMVVPLLSGSGMRVKIIEAMALGKPIVSTTIGAEGIDVEDGKNILIANTATEFLSQIEKCIANQKFCESIGNSAKAVIIEKYATNTITEKLINFYHTLK